MVSACAELREVQILWLYCPVHTACSQGSCRSNAGGRPAFIHMFREGLCVLERDTGPGLE